MLPEMDVMEHDASAFSEPWKYHEAILEGGPQEDYRQWPYIL